MRLPGFLSRPRNPNPFWSDGRAIDWLWARGLMQEDPETPNLYHYSEVPDHRWRLYRVLGTRYRGGRPVTEGGTFGFVEGPVIWHYTTDDLGDSIVRDALWIEAFRMVDASGDWSAGAGWLIDRYEAIHR